MLICNKINYQFLVRKFTDKILLYVSIKLHNYSPLYSSIRKTNKVFKNLLATYILSDSLLETYSYASTVSNSFTASLAKI